MSNRRIAPVAWVRLGSRKSEISGVAEYDALNAEMPIAMPARMQAQNAAREISSVGEFEGDQSARFAGEPEFSLAATRSSKRTEVRRLRSSTDKPPPMRQSARRAT